LGAIDAQGGHVNLEPELSALVAEASWNLCLSPKQVTRALSGGGSALTHRARRELAAEIVRLLIDCKRPELSEASRVQLGELEGSNDE
jgi:hypothetical protein